MTVLRIFTLQRPAHMPGHCLQEGRPKIDKVLGSRRVNRSRRRRADTPRACARRQTHAPNITCDYSNLRLLEIQSVKTADAAYFIETGAIFILSPNSTE